MNLNIPLSRDLVLVGGGHTHALVLRAWAMNPLAGARLTLINPEPSAPYSGMLPGYIAGHYARDALYIDLMRLARAAGARFVQGFVHVIDRDAQQIHIKGRPPIGYDMVSIDVGITSGMPELPGFTDNAIPAKPLDAFAHHWETFCNSDDPADIAILGAGVAGAEIAMAAAHRMKELGRTARVSLIDRSNALSRLGSRARARAMQVLDHLGVDVLEHSDVQAVHKTTVELRDGTHVPAQITLGAAGTRAYEWLSELGLPVTDGYLDVSPTLQSIGDSTVFAVGDCAHLTHAPRPKAGVFAVREAPILTHNLRASLMGSKMRTYQPQNDYLKLISLGGKTALAEKLGVTVSGGWMWKWKDQIDQKFMRQFEDLKPMPAPPLPRDHAAGVQDLPDIMCAGCGSKVGRGTLDKAILAAPKTNRPDVVPLPGDDAALLKMGKTQQVISTDHLRAFTDDPALMTRIAAVHALGDVWSMGATPQALLVSLVMPRMTAPLQERSLAEIMATAHDVANDAGAQIVGGHTTLGAEFTIGFTVTGLTGDKPITLSGAQPGDQLILTKPVGTGVLLAAEMKMAARGADVAKAYASMSRPLARDAKILGDAHAMTDVTGFGLAGHLANICRASGVSASLNARDVRALPGALELSEQGIASSLFPDNLSDALTLMNAPSTARGRLMLDPQTAGGLLACVAASSADDILTELHAEGIDATRIGEIHDGPPRLNLVE